MGLAISVGFLAQLNDLDEEGGQWAAKTFERVNDFLKANNLPTWDEPTERFTTDARPYVSSFPYSFIHYLRRAYAFLYEYPDEPLKPVGPGGLKADDGVVEDATMMFSSHLLCHSDCEGFYVPVDFPEPLFADKEHSVPGDMLGSSYGLMRELRDLAPFLEIALDEEGNLGDEEAARLMELDATEADPFWHEKVVWLTLFESARLSIAHGSAIAFH